jgi:hypothetical protein
MQSEDQQLDENAEATLDETRESENASEDLDSLFEEDSQEDETPEDKVKRLEDKIARIEKGVKKLATDKGREQKEKPTEVKENTENPVIKNLYFKANPEAQDIWDEVTNEAKKLGRDPFELYEGSTYFKGEAKARADAKAEEEKNKAKVNKPSSDVEFSKNIASVKEEDLDKLTPKQKVEWIAAQVAKENASTD